MLLSVYAYGQPVLKKVGKEIDADYPELEKLISDMWETMYHASGVGLAAPQIGRSIRLFVVDTVQMMEEGQEAEGIKMVFINAQMEEETGQKWAFNEGCLSIPGFFEERERPNTIKLKYLDETGAEKVEEFSGLMSFCIQHEIEHLDGILFTDHVSRLKRERVMKKLMKEKKQGVEYYHVHGEHCNHD